MSKKNQRLVTNITFPVINYCRAHFSKISAVGSLLLKLDNLYYMYFIYNHLHYLITNSHELKIRDCPRLLVYKVCAHSYIISWLYVYMVLLIHSYAFVYYLRMLMYHVFFYILSGVAMRRKTFVKRHLTEII
jgi:hypothetical protein